MEKIKVLMISATSKLGGGPNMMFYLADHLKNDHEIFYALPKSRNLRNNVLGKNYAQISERRISFFDIVKLINFVRKNSINIIHAHGKGASLISRIIAFFLNKPLVYTFHGIHLKCHSKIYQYLYIFYENIFGKGDKCKVFVSFSERTYAINSNIKIGNESIVISNGVRNRRKNYFKKFIDKKKYKFPEKRINIISIARFVKQKNIIEILQIASLIPECNFIILGDGPLSPEILFFKDKMQINNVNLLGSKTNIFNYLKRADMFLTTSLYEGLPLSVLEAMSVGLPIIASNVVGNCDTIEHYKSGFLYDLGDIESASKYIRMLSKNDCLRASMSKESINRQRKLFSIKNMSNKYAKIYRKYSR